MYVQKYVYLELYVCDVLVEALVEAQNCFLIQKPLRILHYKLCSSELL